MPSAIADDRLVYSDGNVDPNSSILHAASPFIIGLVCAVIGMALLEPSVLRNGPLIVSALLIPSLIISVGIYAWSVISPGDIVGLIVHPAARSIEIVQSNAFASRRARITFHAIARVNFEQTYDRDGYASSYTVLTLDTGERLRLAFTLDEAELRSLRHTLGFDRASA